MSKRTYSRSERKPQQARSHTNNSVRSTINSARLGRDNFAAYLEDSEDVERPPPAKKQLLTPKDNDADFSARPPVKLRLKMPGPPTEDQIDMVISVSLCDRDTAIRYLRAKSNNVDNAVTAIFDQEDISKLETSNAWDDSVWAGSRDGNTNDQDESRNLQPLGSSTAPTRGPSPAGSFRHPGTKEQEDADMAAALAASTNDVSYGASQETGVLRPDGSTIPAYGPPNRYQNPNEWALVKVTPTTTEITPDVDPVDRRHDGGQPRFLKSASNGDYLPSFLTICHTIPAARELFMLKPYERFDYGIDTEWWKGHPIPLPKIVHTADGSPTDPLLAKYDDFMAELQRLMALLDLSARAYATTNALEQTHGLSLHGKTAQASQRTNVDTFIKELAAAYQSVGQRDDVVERFFGVQAGSEGGDIDNNILEVFHFDVDGPRRLSEILDDVLWDIDAEGEPEDRYLERLPEVLVMRMKQIGSGDTLQVSAQPTIFMDKYLRENVDIVRPMRQKIYHEKRRINKIEAVEKKLNTWQPRVGASVTAQSLLQHAKSQFTSQAEDTVAPLVNGLGESTDHADIAAKLDAIIQSIDQKLAILSEEKVKTQKTLSEMSASPSAEFAADHSDHRYTLVGVSTKPNITYVLRPLEDADMLIDEREEGDDTPVGMQWWRIEYVVNGTKASINYTKVAAYEVLPAIEHEHRTALLVYASDSTLDPTQSPERTLVDGLQVFIQRDNELFQQELREQPPPSYALNFSNDAPRESIERKESLDSIRANRSSDDGEFDVQDPTQHAAYGLGYGADTEYADPPVTEIPPPTDDTLHTDIVHTGGGEAVREEIRAIPDDELLRGDSII